MKSVLMVDISILVLIFSCRNVNFYQFFYMHGDNDTPVATVVPNIFKLFDDADLNQPSSNKPQK